MDTGDYHVDTEDSVMDTLDHGMDPGDNVEDAVDSGVDTEHSGRHFRHWGGQ